MFYLSEKSSGKPCLFDVPNERYHTCCLLSARPRWKRESSAYRFLDRILPPYRDCFDVSFVEDSIYKS